MRNKFIKKYYFSKGDLLIHLRMLQLFQKNMVLIGCG